MAEGNGGALALLMSRATSGPDGGGKIKRRKLRFTVDKSVFEPDMVEGDVEIVLESLSSMTEIEASKKVGNNAGAMVHEMAKAAIVMFGGEPVRDGDLTRDTIWEALGTGGRQMVAKKLGELVQLSDAAEGKADTTMQIYV